MEWIVTDENSNHQQFVKKIEKNIFQCMEIERLNVENEAWYRLSERVIDLTEPGYTPRENVQTFQSFGYEDEMEIFGLYREEAPQIIAECLFEVGCQNDEFTTMKTSDRNLIIQTLKQKGIEEKINWEVLR